MFWDFVGVSGYKGSHATVVVRCLTRKSERFLTALARNVGFIGLWNKRGNTFCNAKEG